MTWSPLAGGFLTGKYEDGVPLYSRASMKVLTRAVHVIQAQFYVGAGAITLQNIGLASKCDM